MKSILDDGEAEDLVLNEIIKWFFLNCRRLKWLYQRIFRGFDDCALWNLDYHISKIILPRLRAFKNLERSGVPGSLCPQDQSDEDFLLAQKQWEKILDSMIEAFDLIVKDDWKTMEEYSEQEKKIDIGLKNFCEYFRGLWD
jgi:hypothetical protein